MRHSAEVQRRGVIVATLVAIALMIASGIGVVGYAWQAIDQSAAAQETRLAALYLGVTQARLEHEAASAGEWDDAYQHVQRRDAAWLDRYLARYYAQSFEHEVTLVFDGAGNAIYGAADGRRLPSGQVSPLAKAALPLVQAVQAAELTRRARIDRRDPDASTQATRSAAIHAGDEVYLLGAASVLPAAYVLTGSQPSAVVVTGRRAGAAFEREIANTLGLMGVRVLPGGSEPQGTGVAALRDFAGRPVASLQWTVSQPGEESAQRLARPALLIFAALVAAWALVGVHIRRLLRALAFRDETLRRSMHELRDARDAAQAASVAKSQFIANISHEIRTPLNGVLGMAQAMSRDDLSAVQRERLAVLQRSGDALLSLLNDVLDLAKIEAGKLDVVDAPFDLSTLLIDVTAAFGALAEAKGVDLRLDVRPEAGGVYVSDATRIRQILQNLVANAVKFTSVGQVSVSATHDGQQLCLEVRDTGPGIPAEAMSRLFGKFEQADASTTRRYGGTGLGLAICAELAGRLGGALEAESIEGEGSVFRLRLPLQPRADLASPASASAEATALRSLVEPVVPAPSLRVLAAEDNPVNQLVLQTLLQQFGVDLRLVDNGADAVTAWRDEAFDLILMDVQMPVMDGPAATRAIRAAEQREGRARTPIVALTANTLAHQQQDYHAAGMDGCLAKPIQITALLETLSSVPALHVETT